MFGMINTTGILNLKKQLNELHIPNTLYRRLDLYMNSNDLRDFFFMRFEKYNYITDKYVYFNWFC